MATTALLIDFLATGVFEDGSPLNGGKVYAYVAGTSTLKDIYTDKDKSAVAASPTVLDAQGRAEVYADGVYDFVIKRSDDTSYLTLDGVSFNVSGVPVQAYVSSYADIETAVAAIGSTATVLMLDSVQTLTGNLTIPSTLTLMPIIKDAIDLDGNTLTINGPVWAPPIQWIKDSNVSPGTLAGTPVTYFWNPIWVESGTLTDSHVYYVPTGKEISNSTPLATTILTTATKMMELDLGTVNAGERFQIEAYVTGTKGGTAGDINIQILKKAGSTATATFIGTATSVGVRAQAAATATFTAQIACNQAKATGAGTLILELYATSDAATSTSASCAMQVTFRNRQ